jgi:hypothetical protein
VFCTPAAITGVDESSCSIHCPKKLEPKELEAKDAFPLEGPGRHRMKSRIGDVDGGEEYE